MPKFLARIGVWGRDLMGRLLGNRPFERPWMINYLDTDLAVDAQPHLRDDGLAPAKEASAATAHALHGRIPENDPNEWHRLNRAAMKEVHLRANLRINRLLEKYLDDICSVLSRPAPVTGIAIALSFVSERARDVLEWRFMILLRHLQNSIRTRDRGLFMTYCQDLAEKRLMQGFGVRELVGALLTINAICVDTLRADPEAEDLSRAIHDYLSMTIQFGCDQILEIYEEVGGEEFEDDF